MKKCEVLINNEWVNAEYERTIFRDGQLKAVVVVYDGDYGNIFTVSTEKVRLNKGVERVRSRYKFLYKGDEVSLLDLDGVQECVSRIRAIYPDGDDKVYGLEGVDGLYPRTRLIKLED